MHSLVVNEPSTSLDSCVVKSLIEYIWRYADIFIAPFRTRLGIFSDVVVEARGQVRGSEVRFADGNVVGLAADEGAVGAGQSVPRHDLVAVVPVAERAAAPRAPDHGGRTGVVEARLGDLARVHFVLRRPVPKRAEPHGLEAHVCVFVSHRGDYKQSP